MRHPWSGRVPVNPSPCGSFSSYPGSPTSPVVFARPSWCCSTHSGGHRMWSPRDIGFTPGATPPFPSCNGPRTGRQRSRSCEKQAANRPPFHWRPWTTAPTYVPCGRFGPISWNAPIGLAAGYAKNLWSPSRTGRCIPATSPRSYVAQRVGFPIWCPPFGRCVRLHCAPPQRPNFFMQGFPPRNCWTSVSGVRGHIDHTCALLSAAHVNINPQFSRRLRPTPRHSRRYHLAPGSNLAGGGKAARRGPGPGAYRA